MAQKVIKSSYEVVGENLVQITIEVDGGAFEAAVQQAYLKSRHKISLPGFRKGRVPRKMIEAQYGKDSFWDEAMEILFPDIYDGVLDEHGIEPVSRAKIESLTEREGGGMVLVLETHTKPEIEAPDYKGLEHTKIDTIASEEEIMQVLHDNAEKNVRVFSVSDRPAEDGDIVTINFEGFVDGVAFDRGKAEGYELLLGSNSFIPGFEPQIVGKEIGEDFDVNVTFPEEYHSNELAGKPSVFKVRITDIKQRDVPQLDDEFAQEISEHDTLEEFKAEIKEKLEERKQTMADREIENELAIELSKRVEANIPRAMVENEINRLMREFINQIESQGWDFERYMQMSGMTAQTLRMGYEETALQTVKGRLAIEAIWKKEGIVITPEEMDEEFERLSEFYKMGKEEFIDHIGEVGRENVEMDAKAKKVMDLMKANAVAVEREQTEDEEEETNE